MRNESKKDGDQGRNVRPSRRRPPILSRARSTLHSTDFSYPEGQNGESWFINQAQPADKNRQDKPTSD